MASEPSALPAIAEVTQSLLAVEDDATVPGNCLQAAVAAALGLPLEAVPHLGTFAWWDTAMKLWLRGRGLDARQVEHVPPIPQERCIVTGKSPRGVYHAVVGEHGRVAWDPHPSRGGLVEVMAAWVIEKWPTPASDRACLICRTVPRSGVSHET